MTRSLARSLTRSRAIFSGKIDDERYDSLLDAMGLSDIGSDDGLYKVYLFNTAEDR